MVSVRSTPGIFCISVVMFLISDSSMTSITTHTDVSKENGILIGVTVGDLHSAMEELSSLNVKIFRDIQERQAGKNAIILDPDGYMISLFEPDFSDNKDKQTSGYVGFTPE